MSNLQTWRLHWSKRLAAHIPHLRNNIVNTQLQFPPHPLFLRPEAKGITVRFYFSPALLPSIVLPCIFNLGAAYGSNPSHGLHDPSRLVPRPEESRHRILLAEYRQGVPCRPLAQHHHRRLPIQPVCGRGMGCRANELLAGLGTAVRHLGRGLEHVWVRRRHFTRTRSATSSTSTFASAR